MRLVLKRRYCKETYSIGNVFILGAWQCNSLEDRDRGLVKNMPLAEINAKKVYGETAIPKGIYNIRMDVVSPKYAAIPWYKVLCGGKMPRLEGVPGFDGILIHPGNTALDTKGCILVGQNTAKGRLTNSRETFKDLYQKMLEAYKRGERLEIEIV